MDRNSQKIIAMLDKMTSAGWIAKSVSREEGGIIEWTDEGKTAMQLLHLLMFRDLDLKPGEESVFAWLVFDFPDAQKRASADQEKPPPE